LLNLKKNCCTRRRKSINDINNQLRRIGELGGAGAGSGFYRTNRGRKTLNAANRYINNIANARGMTINRNGVPFVNNTKRVDRRIYMGLSVG